MSLRTLGLLGGMSWESTALYYRLLNEGVRDRVGGLASAPLLLWSADFAPIARLQAAGAWDDLAEQLADAGARLADAGAGALLICANTMHKVAEAVERRAAVPVLHIADTAGEALRAAGSRRPALLATRYTMEGDFYVGRLAGRFGLSPLIPDEAGREEVHRIIFDELCQGVLREESKAAYLDVISALRDQGADAVIFGCTEIGLLLAQADVDLPVFDTTALHAAAGVAWILAG